MCQFYKRNPFKKKFMKISKFCSKKWGEGQFYKRNPFTRKSMKTSDFRSKLPTEIRYFRHDFLKTYFSVCILKIFWEKSGPRTKFIKEFPLYFIRVQFTRKSFVFFFSKSRLLDWFFKNPTKRVFLILFIRTPNLSKFLNPQEICQDIFFIYV